MASNNETIEVRATNNTLMRQVMTTPGQGMVLIYVTLNGCGKPPRLRSLQGSLMRMAAI
jgi:ABC-type cobalamin/Fe3+-siderophores transport system ATPase subunit